MKKKSQSLFLRTLFAITIASIFLIASCEWCESDSDKDTTEDSQNVTEAVGGDAAQAQETGEESSDIETMQGKEGEDITDAGILNSIELAKLKMSEGNFEEAKAILEAASKAFERLQKLSLYKASATNMVPSKSYTFAIVGGLVIAAGLVLYLK